MKKILTSLRAIFFHLIVLSSFSVAAFAHTGGLPGHDHGHDECDHDHDNTTGNGHHGDACDNCPDDDNKFEPGICGCGEVDVDVDGDGFCDTNGDDNCPNDINKTEPGICGCGEVDVDVDGDLVCDAPTGPDNCPNDINKVDPGICGCGEVDVDADSDGFCDTNGDDNCPADANKQEPGICGCGEVDVDVDGDLVCDAPTGPDNCPNDINKVNPGICGCGEVDVDADSDGYCDTNGDDNCPADANKQEPGICGCGEVDVDVDGDLVCDAPTGPDNCPNDINKVDPGICGCGEVDVDADSDGFCDTNGDDNCPADANKQEPGICGCGEVDVDVDGDLVCDAPTGPDNCPNDINKVDPGICGCGEVDVDADSDGFCDTNGDDNCPSDVNKTEPGICGCGEVDVDADADGVCDTNGDDECPADPNKVEPGECGCGVIDEDLNDNGQADCLCVGACNELDPEFDEDEDGVSNCAEIVDETDPCDDGSFIPRLESSACAGANGFLAQANIATVVNQYDAQLSFEVKYFDSFGILAGEKEFTLEGNQKKDLIVNNMGLEPDTYGTVCVYTDAPYDGAWSGGVSIYKPRVEAVGKAVVANAESVFDYVLYIPFSNPIGRAIRMPLNTNNVGTTGTEETVANWVQLSDATPGDTVPLRGRLIFYGIEGEILQDKLVKLPDGGRFDFSGHLVLGKGKLGAVEFIPKTVDDKFYFVLIRYYPEDKMNFLSAFVMPNVFPTGAERNGRLSTLSDEASVIEVINATDAEIKTTQSAFGTTGLAIYSDKKTKILPKGSAHTIINSGTLGFDTVGSADVSGPTESVTSTTIIYRLNDEGQLVLAYSLPFVESAGVKQFTDFNSFLDQKSFVEVTNTKDIKAETAVVKIYDINGVLLEVLDASLDPKQTKRFELSVPADTLGSIVLDSKGDSGLVLRSFTEKEGQYVLPQTGR